ncbi:Uncharacterised protein [Enterobacter cancerogenus]|uniref:Uncharacterized protein n=1 Tax=Enterobacter cancerogenus TaxID=69218 RepID=A0A484YRY4_9ENTR|nr:Uncharacterised protein [Enterobacter cancerogenus]
MMKRNAYLTTQQDVLTSLRHWAVQSQQQPGSRRHLRSTGESCF